MSRQYSEYNNSTTYSSCNYATLSRYNSNNKGPPVPKGNVSGVYIVPSYTAAGYDTLVHGFPSCSGYPNINDAYNSNDGGCDTQFVKKICQ